MSNFASGDLLRSEKRLATDFPAMLVLIQSAESSLSPLVVFLQASVSDLGTFIAATIAVLLSFKKAFLRHLRVAK